jgi:succinate dehydrogenase/fumarate reductase flavoprotein subunit
LVWDTEVDVLCLGAGIGALATAIAAADADADVIIVSAAQHMPTNPSAALANPDIWLPTTADDETDRYFAALIDGFAVGSRPRSDAVPTRVAAERSEKIRTVATFVGARVADWGAECLQSVTGAVFSTVRGWTVIEMLDGDGRAVLAAPVGDIVCRPGINTEELHRTLISQARARDIGVDLNHPLLRLVFEGGAVVGAVLGDPDGQWAIGARHAVVLGPDVAAAADGAAGDTLSRNLIDGDARVCLVSIPGSRFARVELVSAPA